MPDLAIQCCIGPQVTPYLDAAAKLRIEVFRAFPYLYEGTIDYEREYLLKYAASPDSLFVLALAGPRVVGVSTALPMTDADEPFQQPFLKHGYDVARVFYFGESVLDAAFRGQGVGHRFFDERERYARNLGRFNLTTFCAVERPPNHPRRPADYAPLDPFWHKRGYTKHPELRTEYAWRDLDEKDETPKPMVFWLKQM